MNLSNARFSREKRVKLILICIITIITALLLHNIRSFSESYTEPSGRINLIRTSNSQNNYSVFETNGKTISAGNITNILLNSIHMNETGDLYVTMPDGTETGIGNFIDIFLSSASPEFRALYYGSSGGNGGNGSKTGSGIFTDVHTGDYYYNAVVWAYTTNITTGTSATTFSPLSICTRGQVVTFLWRCFGEPEPRLSSCPFEDVEEADYFYKPVLWAVEQGITTGTSATTFSPDIQCKNSHILAFIYRAMGEPGKTGSGEWYSDAYNWSVLCGLLEGTYTGTFNIEGTCPRCNVVEYLYRYLNLH